MRADTPPVAQNARTPSGVPRSLAPPTFRWSHRSEAVAVAVILTIGALLRFVLSARGWPQMNSDEAVIGLMTDDILWHHAHPAFFYGQQYLGALQAYLAVPIFALLGPTSFALHVTTALETLAFLLLLYFFVRAVYSPIVAQITLALLTLGSQHALHDTLHAGAGTQDTLLFGTLLLLLVYLRVRGPGSVWSRRCLDLGIGLAIGLGLWGDFLIVPFVVAALLALGVEAYRYIARTRSAMRTLVEDLAVMSAGGVVGLLPLIVANIAHNGAPITQVLAASGLLGAGQSASALGPLQKLQSFGLQILATLVVGLPRTLGSPQLCVNCADWPAPDAAHLPVNEILRIVVLSLPFSLGAIGLWTVDALPLARNLRVSLTREPSNIRRRAMSGVAPAASPTTFDARWWGRAMLVLVAALTLLQYAASRASYLYAGSSIRYLVGLFACAPLIVHPLWCWSEPVWHSLVSRSSRHVARAFMRATVRARALQSRERHSPVPVPTHQDQDRVTARRQTRIAAYLSCALLTALFVLHLAGAADAIAQTNDAYQYGVPASGRDAQLLTFLQAHDAARFYATYWTCYRLVFEAHEQALCSVVNNTDAFIPGNNRIPAYVTAVAAAPHPAYVFDLTVRKDDPRLPAQVVAHISQHDPRFAGYTVAHLSGFIIYYYAGIP